MVVGQINVNNQQTRDTFSQEPDTQTIIKLKSDNIKITQTSCISKKINIGNSFILDSTYNAILGTWSKTMNNKDLFLGVQNKVTTQTVTLI